MCNPCGKNHHRGNFPQSSESKVNKKLLVSTTVLFGNHLQQPGSSSGLTKLPFSLAKTRLPYHPSWPKTRRPSALVQRPQTFATGRPGRPGLAHHGLNKRMWIERHPCNDTHIPEIGHCSLISWKRESCWKHFYCYFRKFGGEMLEQSRRSVVIATSGEGPNLSLPMGLFGLPALWEG